MDKALISRSAISPAAGSPGRLAKFIETLSPAADTADFTETICVRTLAGVAAVIALEIGNGTVPKLTTLPMSPNRRPVAG